MQRSCLHIKLVQLDRSGGAQLSIKTSSNFVQEVCKHKQAPRRIQRTYIHFHFIYHNSE